MRSVARPLLALLLCLAQLGDGLGAAWASVTHVCGQHAATDAHTSVPHPTRPQAPSAHSEYGAHRSAAAIAHGGHTQAAPDASRSQIAVGQDTMDCTASRDANPHGDTTPTAPSPADPCDCDDRACGCLVAGCTASLLPAALALYAHGPQRDRRLATEHRYPSPVLPYPLRPPIG